MNIKYKKMGDKKVNINDLFLLEKRARLTFAEY